MPSKTAKQAHTMAAAAHNTAFAKKVGIPVSVAKEFNKADKGKKFREGGIMAKMNHEEKGEMKQDLAQDKKMIKRAVKMHDDQLHGGKKTNLKSLRSGGKVSQLSKADGCAIKGKSKGTEIKMCGGGYMKKGK